MQRPQDIEELERRLPELQEIEDDCLRTRVGIIFLDHCPEYFWQKPASSSGKYHPQDHTGKHGLWIHTKRAFTAYERLSRSYLEAGRITEHERDCGRAAILLHDIFKYGMPEEQNNHTVSEHDRIAYRYLGNSAVHLPDEVLGCIDSHNGPWGVGKAPETELEQLHHSADMIASDRNGHFKILKPHPQIESALQDPGQRR